MLIGHPAGMYLLVLLDPDDALLIWPDGRAVRIRPDGSMLPALERVRAH